MRIAHFAPWAPHRCGLYETVRDIILAERALGHEAELVDVGVEGEGKHIGQEDARPTGTVTARGYDWAARNADIFVVSGGIEESFVARTKQSLVHILHGRPASSFALDLRSGDVAGPYDLIVRRLARSRWKLAVSLWPEHLPYWGLVLPREKLRSTSGPPVDLAAFTPDGPRHEFAGPGPHVLIADLWRDDWPGPFELLHALAAVSPDVRFQIHVYAARDPLGPWKYLFRGLRRQGRLGEVRGHMLGIEKVYRGADLVISGHGIATRVVREAAACGTPVIAGYGGGGAGCPGALYHYLPTLASMTVESEDAIRELSSPERAARLRKLSRQVAERAFDSGDIARELVGFYEEALAAQAQSSAETTAPARRPSGAGLAAGAKRREPHAVVA